MADAISALRASDFAREWLGDRFVETFSATREHQNNSFVQMVPDTELRRFFELG